MHRLLCANCLLRALKPSAEYFQTSLLVTGSNLSRGTTQLFSAVHTRDFPVADAVRISMGLPWFYKPYVIDEANQAGASPGVYVDDGLWNNLPYREFDLREGDSRHSSTLGIRLEIPPSQGNSPPVEPRPGYRDLWNIRNWRIPGA